jgi:hypothetical protein
MPFTVGKAGPTEATMGGRFTLIAGLLLAASTAQAQNVTVQQPIVRNFSVGTTVVAPDRGGSYLGGIRRAADGRFRGGLFPQPAAVGREVSGANVTTHVWIHDLREMDEELLNSAPRPADDTAGLSENATHAARALARNYGPAPSTARSYGSVSSARATPNASRPSSLASAYRVRAQHMAAQGKAKLAESYLRLAQQAEQARR